MSEPSDQAAHAGAAVVALLPFALLPCALTGAWAGFCMGMVREITEEGEIGAGSFRKALGSTRDLIFWTLGGLAVGLL